MVFRVGYRTVLDCCSLQCLCAIFTHREGNAPLSTSGRFLGRVPDTGDRVPEDHVFGLVSCGDDPDLEFTLLADDLLGLAHGDPCKLDTDIPGDPVKARQGINPGITGTEAVDLAIEDPFHIIGGSLRDSLLV